MRRASRLVAATAISLTLTAGAGARAHAASLGGLPAYDHVAIVVIENETESATYDPSGPARYLNATRRQGAFDPQYYATGHVSLDNYIAMVSGQGSSGLSNTDCAAVNLHVCAAVQTAYSGGRNLADQLEAAGRSWKGYMDSMPSPCFHADYSPTAAPPDPYQGDSTAPPAGNYADRHNPFVYFDDIVGNDARCRAHVVPYAQLSSDLAADRVPSFSFITPDTCHDGHDSPCAGGQPGGLVSADAWLASNIPPLLAYMRAHNGLLIITSDEASTSDVSGCCAGGPCLGVCGLGIPGFGGAVGLVALGPHVRTGSITTKYDHASLLRTVEDIFGISEHLNNAAASADMADLFVSATTAGATNSPGSGSESGTGGGSHAGTGSSTAPGLANTSASGVPSVPVALAAAALVLTAAMTAARRRRPASRREP